MFPPKSGGRRQLLRPLSAGSGADEERQGPDHREDSGRPAGESRRGNAADRRCGVAHGWTSRVARILPQPTDPRADTRMPDPVPRKQARNRLHFGLCLYKMVYKVFLR